MALYNDLQPRSGQQIQWREFSELIVSSSNAIGPADPSTVLSNNLSSICREQEKQKNAGEGSNNNPQLHMVAHLPGGLLMPHELKKPLSEFEKRRARDLRTGEEASPMQEHPMRIVKYLPELDCLLRIEKDAKLLSLYHPRSNVIKNVQPEFEKKTRPSVGEG